MGRFAFDAEVIVPPAPPGVCGPSPTRLTPHQLPEDVLPVDDRCLEFLEDFEDVTGSFASGLADGFLHHPLDDLPGLVLRHRGVSPGRVVVDPATLNRHFPLCGVPLPAAHRAISLSTPTTAVFSVFALSVLLVSLTTLATSDAGFAGSAAHRAVDLDFYLVLGEVVEHLLGGDPLVHILGDVDRASALADDRNALLIHLLRDDGQVLDSR